MFTCIFSFIIVVHLYSVVAIHTREANSGIAGRKLQQTTSITAVPAADKLLTLYQSDKVLGERYANFIDYDCSNFIVLTYNCVHISV